MGDDVYLFNPRTVKQKVALGRISNIGGVDKFHYMLIPKNWLKVDVRSVSQPNVVLMFSKVEAEQNTLHNVQGGNLIWDSKYMKFNL